MKNIKLTLNKDVLKKEHHWLKRDFKKGEEFIMYLGYTHGCISKTGIACSTTGKLPFFELPTNQLSFTYEGKEFGIFMKERGWNYRTYYCKEFPMDPIELLTKIQSNAASVESKPITSEQYKENEILKVHVEDGEVTYEGIKLEEITPLF
ncbi:MAG: hypothetical protein IPG89_18275 [Bacteroidetes bacterium]|nr:hypothetical protein [Bacteroidota bacterium]